jgi:hypothetical protein
LPQQQFSQYYGALFLYCYSQWRWWSDSLWATLLMLWVMTCTDSHITFKLLLWTFLCNFINMRPWHFATGRCMVLKSEGWFSNMFALFCSHRAIQTEDTQNGNFCALHGHIPVSEASCASVDINWHMNMSWSSIQYSCCMIFYMQFTYNSTWKFSNNLLFYQTFLYSTWKVAFLWTPITKCASCKSPN